MSHDVSTTAKGTPKVGYMPPEAGPFRCSNCKHYVDKRDGSGCDDREVALDLGKARNGLAPVSPDGCCNEYKPKSKAAARSIGMRLVAIGGSRT